MSIRSAAGAHHLEVCNKEKRRASSQRSSLRGKCQAPNIMLPIGRIRVGRLFLGALSNMMELVVNMFRMNIDPRLKPPLNQRQVVLQGILLVM